MQQKLRFGIIGCGGIALWHLKAIQAIDKAVLTAVSDADVAKSQAWGDEWGVTWYTKAEELIADEQVDVVCICTPSGYHAELAIRALAAKKHVITEKPIAITPESLEKVLEAERDSSASLCAISQLRFSPGVLEAKQRIHSGAIGKILMADLSMKYYREPSYYVNGWRGTYAMDGGGALMNQGIHGVDVLRFLCGDILEVYANAHTLLHAIETEDTLAATFLLENGGMGVLTAATSAYPGHKRRLEICGTEGTLILSEDQLVSLHTKNGITIEQKEEGNYGASDPLAIDFEPHRRQIGAFVECLLSGKPFEPGAEEAAKTLAVIFSVYQSAGSGSPVAIKDYG